ncbi:hypothetical protein A2U01_0050245 [Trifolium medium]|uniref:Uncharacterized protein n=1 Tax=Trifolium medium TaxID=97028 RepID=A0A392QXG4_9FABA|nr:hypothetical protein [Trifolium medium]
MKGSAPELHLAATLLVSLLILLSLSSISSARPLNDFSHLPATTSNLALPSDRTVMPMPEKEEHVLGVLEIRGGGGKGAYYGPLIFNMPPKGKVTPSGPSKGTNNLNSGRASPKNGGGPL